MCLTTHGGRLPLAAKSCSVVQTCCTDLVMIECQSPYVCLYLHLNVFIETQGSGFHLRWLLYSKFLSARKTIQIQTHNVNHWFFSKQTFYCFQDLYLFLFFCWLITIVKNVWVYALASLLGKSSTLFTKHRELHII